jgi:hypothetical protein
MANAIMNYDPAGEGDEYNGAYDEEYMEQMAILEAQQLSKAEEAKRPVIHFARSQPRIPDTQELAFDISYDGGSEWLRVPITSFFDLEDNSVAYDEITDAINDMRQVASNFPSRNRKCICCHRKAISGKILCRSCKPTYNAVVTA